MAICAPPDPLRTGRKLKKLIQSARALANVCNKASPFDAEYRAGFVLFGVITAHSDCTHHAAFAIANQHAPRDGHDTSLRDIAPSKWPCSSWTRTPPRTGTIRPPGMQFN